MAGRMPPSTPVHDNPAARAASSEAATANYSRLQQWIERECAECDAAIDEHRQQVADYRNQKGRLVELQKKISHPIMVPFGSVGFMPGTLVRTNEVLVLLGANHFAECSVYDTTKIIDRRIREINSLIDKLEHQKRNATERLNFAQGLFGGATSGKDGLVEIREDYDEKKEAEARRKRAERAAAARAEKKVQQPEFEDMMSRLDELEREEKKGAAARGRKEEPNSDDEGEEEEEEEEEQPAMTAPPRGVSEEEYKRLLARLDQLDTSDEEDEVDSDDIIEEEDEDVDSDDLSDTAEQKRASVEDMRKQKEAEERRKMIEREAMENQRAAVQKQPPRRLIEVIEDGSTPTIVTAPPVQSITEQTPKMTVVSENDRVVDLVEYQNQQEEDDKSKENAPSSKGKLTHKRSVRFKKNLEAGPVEQKSIDSVDDVVPSLDVLPRTRSILRNKSEESPIDKIAFSEMEDQRSTTILPAGNAFSGCVVERTDEIPVVFKPVDEPPRRVSRFKLQRMQLTSE